MATDARTPAADNWDMLNTGESRPWVQGMYDALIAVGLVQTTDTGQLNIATMTNTASPDASLGYFIFRFNDTLQATAPVFIKIEVGSHLNIGGSSWVSPAIYLTTGQGTNGAGTLTGVGFARTQISGDNSGTSTLANRPIWTSGAANRICQVLQRLGNTAAVVGNWLWAVERTKDASGNDTAEGVHVVMRSSVSGSGQQTTWITQTVIFGIATAQAQAQGPMCVTNHDGTSSDLGNTGFFPWTMASKRGNENPPMGWLSYFYGDVNGGVDVVVSMYGSNHTYRTLGAEPGQANTIGAQRSGWRPSDTGVAVTPSDSVHFAMRWE